jgi:uncharacterized protein
MVIANRMGLRLLRGIAAIGALVVAALPQAGHAQYNAERVNQGVVGIVSGGVAGTYVQFANDLAAVLDGDKLRILPILGKGSIQNVIDILYLRGVDVGIVQSDVLAYLRRDGQFPGLERRLHYLTKLYNEEFHLLARADIGSIRDLAGQKVNVDGRNSGSFMTATIVFGAHKVAIEPTFYDQALALEKLKSGEIAAMVYVAGKPASLFRNVASEDKVKLLAVPATPELLESYFPSQLTSAEYPRLIPAGGEVETVAVGAVMAVFNWPIDTERYKNVARFVDALFTNIEAFRAKPRHPKWQEVSLSAQPPGWTRFRAAEEWLQRHGAQAQLARELADPKLRQAFEQFMAESKSAHLDKLTREQREALYQNFVRWQRSLQ